MGSPAPNRDAETTIDFTPAIAPISSRQIVSKSEDGQDRSSASVTLITTLATVPPEPAEPPKGPPPPAATPTTILVFSITSGAPAGRLCVILSPARNPARRTSSATAWVRENAVPSFISIFAVMKAPSMDGKNSNFTYPCAMTATVTIIMPIVAPIGTSQRRVTKSRMASSGLRMNH